MKKPFLCLALYLSMYSICVAEEIQFEIYRIEGGNQRVLIEQASMQYRVSDWVVTPQYRGGSFYGNRKELGLARGFSIGQTDVYDVSLTGFALWVDQLPPKSSTDDFSWEWFVKVREDRFRQREGGATLETRTRRRPASEELIYVEFQSDVEIDYIQDICCTNPGDPPSHVVVIKAGSKLVFPSITPEEASRVDLETTTLTSR